MNGVPAPTAGAVLVNQYSPPATPVPLAPSVAPVRVSVVVPGGASTWVGLTVIPVNVGAVLSITRVVATAGPQLPAASLARTQMVWLPTLRVLTVVSGMSP